MAASQSSSESSGGPSKIKLALGAAGLFLFIIGAKRTFSTGSTTETDPLSAGREAGQTKTERGTAGTAKR